MDEIKRRKSMEASENTAPSRRRGGGPALHRIDPDRVAGSFSAAGNAEGFARLSLMVGPIFDRLVADSGENRK